MSVTKQFITAGDAIFTIEIPAEHRPADAKPHYTYRVEHVKANDRYPESYFVKVLTGPENTDDYTYLGKLNVEYGEVTTTAKSRSYAGTYLLRILNRVLDKIWRQEQESFERLGFKVHHEGRCGRCGALLTVPASIESGFGPECIKKVRKLQLESQLTF